MYRCLALVWDREDPRASSVAAEIARRLGESPVAWEHVISDPGLMAFHAGAGGTHATSRHEVTSCETRVLDGNAGVLFGRAFSLGHELDFHPYGSPLPALETNRICASGGLHLIEQYWGRYFALFRDLAGRRVSVLRDPTGGLPCFLAQVEGVQLVFSEIESVLALGLLAFSVNWRYVSSFVAYSALQISETGLNEVTEVQPGERVTFNEGKREYEQLWKPADVAARFRIESPVVAIAAVRETVRQCVSAWASLHRSVVLNLSGGLDSSIVLSALRSAQSQPDIACLHYYSPATGEDEREYARLVAHRLDTELVECPLDGTAARLDRLLNVRPSPRPWPYIYDLVHSPVEVGVMNERGATGLFSGAGGDGLFVQTRAELAVADFLHYRGIRPDVFRVALNAARINRSSVWPIISQGFFRRLSSKPGIALPAFTEGASAVPREVYERVRNDDCLVHAWIRHAPRAIAPGLLWQILCNSVPSPFYESFGGGTEIERTPVLVSQPLVELCLRIPTYVWISGGQNRSIARRAFSDALPPAIVRRTRKGLIDRYNRKMLDANAAFISDMLLDGQLVKAGLLDRRQLEGHIRADASSASLQYNEVLRQHLCTEVWLRQWMALTTSSAS